MVSEILFTVVVALSALLAAQHMHGEKLKAYYQGREVFYAAKLRGMKIALQRALTATTEEALDLSMQQMVADLDDREF